ncbi:immunoglobulin-like domain-containing protein [Enterococcus sp. MMGLQ5-1]|uniref:immunoglobulin-like domain-containing protein n=1 Tax=Enterococcus sp. MMGLQ5-1 TaxID=2737663 RepID=UPI0032DEB86D
MNDYSSSNDEQISGVYSGGVINQAKLIVNGTVLSTGGDFDNGTFTYWVGASILTVSDNVQLEFYSDGSLVQIKTLKIIG